MSRHRGYLLVSLPVVLLACADVIGADWDDVRPKGGRGAKSPKGGTDSHTTGGTVSGSGGVAGFNEPGDGGGENGGASVGGGAASHAGVDQGGSGGNDAGQGGHDAGQGGNDGGHGGRGEPEIVCGDGFLSAGSEECDDHNQLSGDGCSRQCELEPTKVVLSFDHSCALLGGTQVKCWGWNDAGALGLGDTFDRGATPSQMGDGLPFVDLGSGRSARDLYAGDGYSCALLDDGSVKCWGHNARGELGLGHLRQLGDERGEMGDALLPLELGTNERPASFALGASDGRCTLPEVSCSDNTRHGDGHTCVRFTSGRAKCWGVGTVGQLGLGDTSDRGGHEGDMGDQLPAVALGTAAAVEM
ncbi:MAG TPA: DUF4215 domain-containing protein, partial [Candidatus Eisenbacteria bacterium]|nr:DUF4215 domain-containing protein [Candidatus Eisenbacteria bacterium]